MSFAVFEASTLMVHVSQKDKSKSVIWRILLRTYFSYFFLPATRLCFLNSVLSIITLRMATKAKITQKTFSPCADDFQQKMTHTKRRRQKKAFMRNAHSVKKMKIC